MKTNKFIIVKKKYVPPLFSVMRIEMEFGLACGSDCFDHQKSINRWSSSDKYIRVMENMKKEE